MIILVVSSTIILVVLACIFAIRRWRQQMRTDLGNLNKGLAALKLKAERILQTKNLDFASLVQLNSHCYPEPSFDTRRENIVVFTPFGCFIGKKNSRLFESLAAAGYFQERLEKFPVLESSIPGKAIPYNPETCQAISGKVLEAWQRLERTWVHRTIVRENPHQTFLQLQEIFRQNAKAAKQAVS